MRLALSEALEDKNAAVRTAAVSGLGRLGSFAKGEVPRRLARMLEDVHADLRRSAAFALGEIGPAARDGVFQLIQALKDENEAVRETAASSLAKIGPAAGCSARACSGTERSQRPRTPRCSLYPRKSWLRTESRDSRSARGVKGS